MNLKNVELVPEKSTVILRLDLDLPISDGKILDSSRLKKSLATVNFLLSRSCQLVIIGHLGRPSTVDEKYSLRPVYLEFLSLLAASSSQNQNSIFLDDPRDPQPLKLALSQNQIIFMENLRFWPDEEAGSFVFLQPLIDQSQAFVNDAIAAYHSSASINLHHVLPGYYGLNFLEEVSALTKLASSPHPFTVILGGAKADKLSYLPALLGIADHVLIGGKLPQLSPLSNPKVFTATLTPDTFDIDADSISRFTEVINQSQSVVWSGAMGFYENPAARAGTIAIAQAVADSPATFKIIAGGDTSASIKDLGMLDKINFVCSGGGVLLEFLTKGTLPALE